MKAVVFAAAAALAASTAVAQSLIPGWAPGYLDAAAVRSVSTLPPPPADQTADRAAYEATRALKGSPRWALAAADVPLDAAAPARVFGCALGKPIEGPVLTLLDRVKTDAGAATGPAKAQYARSRPFVGEASPRTCTVMTPDQATQSYPSGHASIGWAWALVLAELAPDRAEPLLARGRAFGESRAICGVHYPSDVAAGREIAAGVVARLHADPAFRADLERVRAALAAIGPAPVAPACDSEATILAVATVEQPASISDDARRPILDPVWARIPTVDDFVRLYPVKAARERKNGTATVECVARADGGFSSCNLVSLSPADSEFGEATLRLTQFFRLRSTTKDGASVEGRPVQIPVRWNAR